MLVTSVGGIHQGYRVTGGQFQAAPLASHRGSSDARQEDAACVSTTDGRVSEPPQIRREKRVQRPLLHVNL